MDKLTIIRDEIDKIDDELIDLLDRRLELALKTATEKKKIKDLSRQKSIIDRLNSYNKKNLDKTFINDLYKIIFKQSRKLQKQKSIYIKTIK